MDDKNYTYRYKKTRKLNRVRREKAGGVENASQVIKKLGDCAICGCKDNIEIHHMIPISYGGTTDKRNLVCLCHKCHASATEYHQKLRRNDLLTK